MAERQARAQTQDLAGPVPLQPAGLPGDTFVQAEKPVTLPYGALADSLTHFNSNLGRYGTEALRAQMANRANDDMAKANKLIAGHTNEQWLTAVQEGRIPGFQTPLANVAIGRFTGQNSAQSVLQSIEQRIKAGEINLLDPATNIAGLITDEAKPHLEAGQQAPWGSDAAGGWGKGFNAGFASKLEGYRDGLLKRQVELRQGAFETGRDAQITQTFSDAISTAADADTALSRVREAYPHFKQLFPFNESKGKPNQQLDDNLMGVIKKLASQKGQVEKAIGLWNSERVGDDGAKVPALSANPRYAADKVTLDETFKRTLGTKWDDTQEALVRTSAEQALERADGSFAAVADHNYSNPYTGEFKRLSGDRSKGDAVTSFLQRSAAKKDDFNSQFEREWRVVEKGDVSHPVWKDALSAVPRTFANATSITDPDSRQKAITAAGVMMKINERNYSYGKNKLGLDKNAQDFYTVFEVARRNLGYNDDKALDAASTAIRSPQNEDDMQVRQMRRKEVESQVKANFTSWFGGSAENRGEMQKRVMDSAELFTRIQGVDVDTAVKQAVEITKKRTLIINGQAVPNTGIDDAGRPVPGTLPAAKQQKQVEALLDIIAKQHGATIGVKKGSELSIMPAGGGNYRVTEKTSGVSLPTYVLGDDGTARPAIISRQQIEAMQQKADAVVETRRKEDQKAALNKAQQGVVDEMIYLDTREQGLGASGLGGAFRQAQERKIAERRTKLTKENAAWLPAALEFRKKDKSGPDIGGFVTFN